MNIINGSNNACLISFLKQFLTDIGVTSEMSRNTIISAVIGSIAEYELTKPGTTLTSIISTLLKCVKTTLDESARNVVNINISIIAVIAVITIVVSVIICAIIMYTVEYTTVYAVLVIIVYIIILVAVLFSGRSRLDALISQTETKLASCLSNAESSFSQFESQQLTAINNALCTYATLS